MSNSGSSWDERVNIGGKSRVSESGRSIGVELEIVGSSLLNINSDQLSNDSSERVSGDYNSWVLGGVLGFKVLVGIQESSLDILIGLVESLMNTASTASWIIDLVSLEVIIPVNDIAGSSNGDENIIIGRIIGSITLTFMSLIIDNSNIFHSF